MEGGGGGERERRDGERCLKHGGNSFGAKHICKYFRIVILLEKIKKVFVLCRRTMICNSVYKYPFLG